ncbi:MAG: hypothetical protein B6U94_00035 [Thermofilum sp. ex4484_79]|nr:MAG: hypothetical protein B6U94_00035 [Thermofilum sp. ex4484_79]
MELPLYKRNPRVEDWKQSFILYLYASIKYNWSNLPLISYYYGNDFVKMGKSPQLHEYYRFIYEHTTGKLTEEELEPYIKHALEKFQRRKTLLYLMVGIPLAVSLIIIYTIYKTHKDSESRK